MPNNVTIIVNGQSFEGWQTVSFNSSLENLSGDFSIAYTDRWSGVSQPWPIREQDAIELLVDNKTLMVGFVDAISAPLSVSSHRLTIKGREVTADLVDNSAIIKTQSWTSTTFENVIKSLTEPFGIGYEIVGKKPTDKFAFAIQSGDSVFDNLVRLAAKFGFLLRTSSAGELIVKSSGWDQPSTGLAVGYNIKTATCSYDTTNRYQKYIVRGQDSGKGQKSWSKSKPASAHGSATDEGVFRNRVLLLQSETNATNKSAKRRAEWERDNRRAKALTVGVGVEGWYQTDSDQLWAPGILINVFIPEFELKDMQLLIKSVSFRMTEKTGTTAALELCHPDSFLPEPPKRKTTAGGGNRWK